MLKRMFSTLLKTLATALFFPILYSFVFSLIEDGFYPLLTEIFPNTFLPYYILRNLGELERVVLKLKFTSGLITVFILNFIPPIYSFDRYMDVAQKTNGLFRIKDIYLYHLICTLPYDLAASLFTPLIFGTLVNINFTNEKVGLFVAKQLEFYTLFTNKFGALTGFFIFAAAALLSRVLSIFPALLHYRAKWICSFNDR